MHPGILILFQNFWMANACSIQSEEMQLSSIGTATSSSTESPHKHGSHPKWTTDINKRIAGKKEKEGVNEIAIIWNQQVNDAHGRGIKNMPNLLEVLIQERKTLYNMTTSLKQSNPV